MDKKMYNEPNEVYAIVMGNLFKTFNKAQVSQFNKIVLELGYERTNVQGLQEIANKIDSVPALSELAMEAEEGNIGLDQIAKYKTGKIPFDDKTLHSVITPYQVAHQRVLKENREFNKYQRQGAYTKALFEDLLVYLGAELPDFGTTFSSREVKQTATKKGTSLVVNISDWHIGATIQNDYTHGGYNYTKLIERLDTLLLETYEMASHYDIEEIVCLFAGDMIEGADMRGGQKWGLEFSMAEQIAKGTRTLADFLHELELIAPVRFGAVRGNHDRLTGQANKKDSIYNDSAMFVVLDSLKLMQDQGALPNTEIVDNQNNMYDLELTIQDKIVHVNHGDMLKGKVSHFSKFIKEHPIDILITGHVHNFNIRQDDNKRFQMVVGSPMGYNNYSEELQLEETAPSQTLMLISEGRDPIIQTVYFGEGN